jgi:hypothetical protein
MKTPQDPLVAGLVGLLDADLREKFEERAGIVEFDGLVPRAHAECLALLDVLKSHPQVLARHWLFRANFQGAKRCFLTTRRELALDPLEPAAVLDEQFHGTALLSPL